MRAATTRGPGALLAINEVNDPIPSPEQLLVRVEACGICGSDLHIADRPDSAGRILGHEFSGEVVSVGSEVEGFHGGERIAVFPVVGCGVCRACLNGNPTKCSSNQLIGGRLPGAYAEYVAVHQRQAYALPDSISYAFGAAVEPLAVALRVWQKSKAEKGEPVLVIGGGPVGQAVALWAKHFGSSDVVLSDPIGHRRELAERAGASATVDPAREDVAHAFRSFTGAEPRVVIECVGVPGMIQRALEVAIPDGHVTIAGMCMGTDEIIPTTAFGKELEIQFVRMYAQDDFDATIRLLDRGILDPSPLITDQIPLADVPKRFEALKHPTTKCKVIIEP
jgi:(R,R)-butanediol dehydrogenase / meso-butanediol dehydrogenase / diacetyl reductase